MGAVTGGPAVGARKPRYYEQVIKMASRIDTGTLNVELPDGSVTTITGEHAGPTGVIRVKDPDAFARIVRQGVLGFAEGYMDGDWETDDLQNLMDVLYTQVHHFYVSFPGAGLVRTYEKIRFWLQSNSRAQARKNISHHYDLGNDFYSAWLDDTMTYSAAKFENPQESLEAAQTRKYKSMVDQMGAKPGDHVLEIGCGWGGFAEYAAKERGLKVTGLTISKEQHDYAVERMKRAGVADQVQIKMQDYRDETGTYNGIASIEMFEAVGEKYWPIYFAKLRDCLKPGANATLQIITIHEDRFANYRKTVDFIQKYIFPGGMLPTAEVLREQATSQGLSVKNSIEFGMGYSLTLRRWHAVFNEKWDALTKLGFDDRFKRMWDFYLTSCAASFESGNTDITQITLTRQA